MASVVFFSPHQDDETLSMGPAIRRHVEAGHDVHVVLLTTGINSAVRAQTGLSRTRFAAARDDEYRRACTRLGVPAANQHISRYSCPDGALTQAVAEDALRSYLDDVPGAWVKTYSHLTWPDRHSDHVATGRAAAALARAGTISNLRFYVEPWQLSTARQATGVSVAAERANDTAAVVAALDEYTVVDRGAGRFGIGGLSVPSAFAVVRGDPVSYYHLP